MGEGRGENTEGKGSRAPLVARRQDKREEEEIATYVIRDSNCCRRVTGDYFLIAAIKRTRSPRIGARIAHI